MSLVSRMQHCNVSAASHYNGCTGLYSNCSMCVPVGNGINPLPFWLKRQEVLRLSSVRVAINWSPLFGLSVQIGIITIDRLSTMTSNVNDLTTTSSVPGPSASMIVDSAGSPSTEIESPVPDGVLPTTAIMHQPRTPRGMPFGLSSTGYEPNAAPVPTIQGESPLVRPPSTSVS